jgi:hypothetical protein
MAAWTETERKLLRRLDTPFKVQLYLNGLGYDAVPGTRSPRWVIHERKANCFEGALLAAAALGFHGRPPLIVDLRATNDDDHVIAVFKADGGWGAVAKSNYTTLRFREPVYRSVRELVMSYFDFYFNPLGDKTLREYSRPMSLERFDKEEWLTTDEDISDIGEALDAVKHYRVLGPRQIKRLQPMDRDVVRAGMLGAKKKGLFKAKKS